jgi:hypothetical protein
MRVDRLRLSAPSPSMLQGRPGRVGRRQGGASALEALLALPLLLMMGLGALQFAWVYQAKQALEHALVEAARSGSVAYAQPAAIREGLARGLLPWLFGAADPGEYLVNLGLSLAHVSAGEQAGWLVLRQVSPAAEAFEDWAEPARGPDGRLVPGVVEIPNDGLRHRSRFARPASGVAGWQGAAAIGLASGQSLSDANLLRLHLHYGVPLRVPLIGRLLGWALGAWHRCGPLERRRAGAIDLGTPQPGPVPGMPCALIGGPDGVARVPVSRVATVRMQSAARHPGAAAAPGPGGRARDAGTSLSESVRGAPPAAPASSAPPDPASARTPPPMPPLGAVGPVQPGAIAPASTVPDTDAAFCRAASA